MDIAKFIENLQNKPEGTKKVILWVTTAVIMVIIGSGWIVSLQGEGTVNMNPSQAQKQEKNNFANIFESFKQDMASLGDQFSPKFNRKEPKEAQQSAPASMEESQKEADQERELYKLPLSN